MTAETIQARFDKAFKEFCKLEGVDCDPARCQTVQDLVYIAQFEVDLADEGDSEIDVRQHRRFLKKYAA